MKLQKFPFKFLKNLTKKISRSQFNKLKKMKVCRSQWKDFTRLICEKRGTREWWPKFSKLILFGRRLPILFPMFLEW